MDGRRIGELLALTKQDINFEKNQININKTYYRTNGQDIITEPKTKQSIRTVEIPEFLKQEIKCFIDRHYGMPDDERIFPIVQEAVQHKMKRHIEKSGVKYIRVHDTRQLKVKHKTKILLSFLQKIFYFPFNLYAVFFKNINFINKKIY